MTTSPFSTRTRPLIIGHRGAPGHAPENSRAGFELVVTSGHNAQCDGVELDLHTTADGEFVVHHDAVLSTGVPIATVSARTVRAIHLADGSPIPTLSEALAILGGLDVFIEAKSLPAASEGRFLTALRSFPEARTHVHAFDHRVIARLHRVDPALSLGVLSRSYPLDPLHQVRAVGAGTLWQEAHLIDEELVDTCRHGGIALIAWTVNSVEAAHKLTALGVDGLCGDWPERLRSEANLEQTPG